MTYLVPDQDKIYISTNDKTKPIKLVYESHAKVMEDSCTIDFKPSVLGTYSFDDCTVSLYDSLFEKYYGDDINGKNIKPDASHFKSLL